MFIVNVENHWKEEATLVVYMFTLENLCQFTKLELARLKEYYILS